ncbi:MAG: oligosaccharide flippase family protein [Actinomycetota bacterium]|nr:oligosaccharide flippase family protein [Actinomycetota bacterium]
MQTPERTVHRVRGLDTLFADFAGVTGAQVATLVLGVLTVVLTARILAPEEYAVIAYMTLGGAFITFASCAWSNAAVMRYGREELDRTASLQRSVWARVALTLPIVVVVSALLPALKGAGALPPEFTWTYVWLTLALGLFFVVGEQLSVVLNAAGRMRLAAAATAGRQALLVLGLVAIAISATGRSILAVAWLTVLVAAALTLALLAALRGLRLWPPALDRSQLRRMLIFSLPMIAFAASQYGMRSVDVIVLRVFSAPEEVGVYALAYQSYTMLQSLAVAVTIVLIPLFVSLREANREELVARYFERVVPQLIFAASIFAGLLAPLVMISVPIAFGPAFEEAARPLALLIAALALFAVASLLAPILMLHERTRETSVINVVAFGLNVVGDVVLIGVLDAGIAGPAIATIAALAVIVAGYFVVARRDLQTSPVLSIALVLPLAAGVLPAVLVDGFLGVSLGFMASALVAAVVLSRLRLFAHEDADLVERLDLPLPIRQGAVAAIRRLARG